MHIPNHATCIWVEKRPDGNYDAYSLGTFGLDKNGNKFGHRIDSEKEKGYKTIQEAVNSLMEKFKEPGLDVEESIN